MASKILATFRAVTTWTCNNERYVYTKVQTLGVVGKTLSTSHVTEVFQLVFNLKIQFLKAL